MVYRIPKLKYVKVKEDVKKLFVSLSSVTLSNLPLIARWALGKVDNITFFTSMVSCYGNSLLSYFLAKRK